MTETTKYKRKRDVPWQILDNHAIVLTPTESSVHELNVTATRVWEKLENECSFAELHQDLCESFEVTPEQADQDLKNLLQSMVEKRMIE